MDGCREMHMHFGAKIPHLRQQTANDDDDDDDDDNHDRWILPAENSKSKRFPIGSFLLVFFCVCVLIYFRREFVWLEMYQFEHDIDWI